LFWLGAAVAFTQIESRLELVGSAADMASGVSDVVERPSNAFRQAAGLIFSD
jgi:hypothetical protein